MRLLLLLSFFIIYLSPLNAAEFDLKVSFPEGSTDFEVKNAIKTGFESAIFALPKYFEEGSDLKVKILVIEGRNKIDITATSIGEMKVSEKVSGLKREAVILGKNLAIRFARKLLRKEGISLSKADKAVMAGGKISKRKKKQVIVFDLSGEGDKKLISILSARIRSNLASIKALDVKDKALMENQMLDAGLNKEKCTDLSCQIEIAGALGVEEAVTGQYSKISGLTIITLNRVAIDTNSTIDTKTAEIETSSAKELIKLSAKLSKELYKIDQPPIKQVIAKKVKKDSSEKDFWEAVQTSKDKADFEAYLKEYPNGKYQTIARLKIKQIKRESLKTKSLGTYKGPDAESEFWNAIKSSEDKADFKSYLETYPKGKYQKIAKIKLKNLSKTKAESSKALSKEKTRPQKASDCPEGQHKENQICTLNTRPCKIANGRGKQQWADNKWGLCKADFCNDTFEIEAGRCIKVSELDPRSCKVKNTDAFRKKKVSELGLSQGRWCGDIKGRFQKLNSGKKFIYDSMLNGYWSRRSSYNMKWNHAKAYCQKLGPRWQLPDVYKMLSLFSQYNDNIFKLGYINPVFSDNNSTFFNFWSSSRADILAVWKVDFTWSRLDGYSKELPLGVRCFKAK